MTESLPLCPNCHAPWPPSAEFCPNCGRQRPLSAPPDSSATGGGTWPPPPSNYAMPVPPPPPSPKLVTGQAWGDITLGIGLTLASGFVYCLGLIVMPVLYFVLKPTYPVFTRGIGFGLLGMLVLLMGALIACFGGVNWGKL